MLFNTMNLSNVVLSCKMEIKNERKKLEFV